VHHLLLRNVHSVGESIRTTEGVARPTDIGDHEVADIVDYVSWRDVIRPPHDVRSVEGGRTPWASHEQRSRLPERLTRARRGRVGAGAQVDRGAPHIWHIGKACVTIENLLRVESSTGADALE